jgi:hypothetical protein
VKFWIAVVGLPWKWKFAQNAEKEAGLLLRQAPAPANTKRSNAAMETATGMPAWVWVVL